MRKSTALLSISTLGFAALSAYLALRLHQADPAADPQSLTCATTTPVRDSRAASSPTPGALCTSTSLDPGNPAQAAEQHTNDEYKQQMLRDFADPAKRADMLARYKRSLRAEQPRLAAYLGLKEPQYDELLELLSDDMLRLQERNLRCDSPECFSLDIARADVEARHRRIAERFSPELAARHQAYEQSMNERHSVGSFRASLPDAIRLTDDQAEKLIAALADERQRFETEVQSRGLEVRGSGNSHGSVLWDSTQTTLEDRLAAARGFSERLRGRAATVLSSAQETEFARSQDMMLDQMADFLPYQDSMAAARK